MGRLTDSSLDVSRRRGVVLPRVYGQNPRPLVHPSSFVCPPSFLLGRLRGHVLDLSAPDIHAAPPVVVTRLGVLRFVLVLVLVPVFLPGPAHVPELLLLPRPRVELLPRALLDLKGIHVLGKRRVRVRIYGGLVVRVWLRGGEGLWWWRKGRGWGGVRLLRRAGVGVDEW
jgi:hypothetical protein